MSSLDLGERGSRYHASRIGWLGAALICGAPALALIAVQLIGWAS